MRGGEKGDKHPKNFISYRNLPDYQNITNEVLDFAESFSTFMMSLSGGDTIGYLKLLETEYVKVLQIHKAKLKIAERNTPPK